MTSLPVFPCLRRSPTFCRGRQDEDSTMAEKRIKLTNGTSVAARLVAAVNYSEDTHRVFLKNEAGDTLCSIRCEDEELAQAQIRLINEQMNW